MQAAKFSAHRFDLDHALRVVLDEVLFVGILPVDCVGLFSFIVNLGVTVDVNCMRFVVVESSWLTMIVEGKYVCERVFHFQFTVEGRAKEGTVWVETSISHCKFGGRRLYVVWGVIWQQALRGQSSRHGT